MIMMHAVEIMSRNRDGKFQWMPQLVSILNAMGDLSVDELSTVDEVLDSISRLDNDSKDTLFAIKVIFNDEFEELMMEEEKKIKKESMKYFLVAAILLVLLTAGVTIYGDAYGVEPETLHKFMEFTIAILKMLSGQPIE